MKLLITGGTGLIGRALVQRLCQRYQITVLTRHPKRAIDCFGKTVQTLGSLAEIKSISDYCAVINLQGEGIADKRWSERQKLRIEQSRWTITRQLTELMQQAEQPPAVFISGSAIGIYGPRDSTPVTESSSVQGDDFAHHLCAEWERLALAAQSPRTRVCVLRTGVVLAPKGGALQKMLPPYLLGLGGPLGHGKQGFSWIQLDDIVGIIEHLLEHADCQGIYNGTAPNPVSQAELSASIAKVLRKSHFMRVPGVVLKLALGELSSMLLTGQYVLPERTQAAGYVFKYPTVEAALKACLLPPSE
ncbi:TIGR01777 family oxidoreductase [Pseudidiomarina mangrovi]|uniref:TIGR01777 family oxidoreductase n=1 Tax=Pseudidiomarina mangrovi TaxID=2487133 RepID=UPI000FCBA72E|nr:TIGR01777 family oxidoreductase [Pseudidiomarina mangrovi]